MSKNVWDKILLLVTDIEAFDRMGKARAIERFLRSELNLSESVHYLTYHDLTVIKSRAAALFTDTPIGAKVDGQKIHSDPDTHRTACFVEATIQFLRGMNLLASPFAFRPDKKAEPLVFCDHRSAEKKPDGSYLCPLCGDRVYPVMWSSRK